MNRIGRISQLYKKSYRGFGTGKGINCACCVKSIPNLAVMIQVVDQCTNIIAVAFIIAQAIYTVAVKAESQVIVCWAAGPVNLANATE